MAHAPAETAKIQKLLNGENAIIEGIIRKNTLLEITTTTLLSSSLWKHMECSRKESKLRCSWRQRFGWQSIDNAKAAYPLHMDRRLKTVLEVIAQK